MHRTLTGINAPQQTIREMKKLNIVLGVLIGVAISYLLFTFVKMDFNARNWSEDARFGCSLISIMLGLVAAILTAWVINEEADQ